jgi:RNA-directed DNA polymerase
MAGVAGTMCPTHTENWQMLPWRQFQRNVFRLQQRIFQAARRGNHKRVRNLQRLLLRSWSARCLAVKRVSQDNRGKRTPGVDGVASLSPEQRMALTKELRDLPNWKADPIRRKYISKRGTKEKRGLAIPTMRDRAAQTLTKLALEPEWEARFEPNSYGFRPGRSTHDAIEAIFNFICRQPKYVYDTDIEKCFDRIDRDALKKKLNAIQPITRLIQGWLNAGIVDEGKTLFPETGTPQGSPLSPLLCNIALHGLERDLATVSKRHRVVVIRFADDLVILCKDLDTLMEAKRKADTWLGMMGLRLKPSKSRVTHTLEKHEGNVGFDFLGFNIRQYKVGKYRTYTYGGKAGFKTFIKPSKEACKRHLKTVREVTRRHRCAPQAALIAALNPIIKGWAQYYSTCVAKRTFSWTGNQVFHKLYRWARRRHPNKTGGWCFKRYWQRRNNRNHFGDGTNWLTKYTDTPIKRHVKIRSDKSPYDGDWIYWALRLSRDPTRPTRVIRLLKRENGGCIWCGLRFTAEDVMEVHHWDGDRTNHRYVNLALLHGHCHDQIHGNGTDGNSSCAEEPCKGKAFTHGSGLAVGRATAPPTITL